MILLNVFDMHFDFIGLTMVMKWASVFVSVSAAVLGGIYVVQVVSRAIDVFTLQSGTNGSFNCSMCLLK